MLLHSSITGNFALSASEMNEPKRFISALVTFQAKTSQTQRQLEILGQADWVAVDLSSELMLFQKPFYPSSVFEHYKSMLITSAMFAFAGPLSFKFWLSGQYQDCQTGSAKTGVDHCKLYFTGRFTFREKTDGADLMLKWFATQGWSIFSFDTNVCVAQKRMHRATDWDAYTRALKRMVIFVFRGAQLETTMQDELGQFPMKVTLKDMNRPQRVKASNLALVDMKGRFSGDNVELQFHKSMAPMCFLKNTEFLPPDMVKTRFWKSGQLVDKKT